MKSTKKNYFLSLVSLTLSILMLLGSTLAWFSESIKSGDNNIVAGVLDLDVLWTDDLENGEWKTIKGDETIFDGDLWEPGFTQLRYIKVENEGDLAFKYKLNIAAVGAVGALADAINVYYIPQVTESIDSREALINDEDRPAVGTLRAVLDNLNTGVFDMEGTLLPEGKGDSSGSPDGETVCALGLAMRTDAGNEYQNATLGDGFYITATATQIDYESDSFDNKYDLGIEFPKINLPKSISVVASLNANNEATSDITLENGSDVKAVIKAGTKFKPGTQNYLLSVTKKSVDSNIVDEGDLSRVLDIHIDNVASDNTVPIIITIKNAIPRDMNVGAIALQHKEGGTYNAMTYKTDASGLTSHNTYTFDTEGTLTMALCSFSDVMMTVKMSNPWDGTADTSWYNTSATSFTLTDVDQLAGLAKLVNDGTDSFEGKTINLGGVYNVWQFNSSTSAAADRKYFTPIGQGTGISKETGSTAYRPFMGTFNGNGITLAGMYETYYLTPAETTKSIGLFGTVKNAVIKNITISDSYIETYGGTVGLVATYATGNTTFENIKLYDNFASTNNNYLGGVLGCAFNESGSGSKAVITINNASVGATNHFKALWGTYDLPCGGLVGCAYAKSDITINSSIVSCKMTLYNDCCANYQWFAYRYSGMLVGYLQGKAADVKSFAENNIHCSDVQVILGEWTSQYYCELVALGKGSYNGAHQWKYTRINNSQVVRDDSGKIIGCTAHDHAANNLASGSSEDEDNIAVNINFDQLFGGGQGIYGIKTHSGVTITKESEFIDIKLPNVDKYLYRVGNQNTVALGSLFKVRDGVSATIPASAVSVTTEPAEISNSSNNSTGVTACEFTRGSTWTASTLKFTGTGPVKVTLDCFGEKTILNLEVIDATNVTTSTSATTKDIVLLNDTSGGFTVQNGHTFYGNGFTVTAYGTGAARYKTMTEAMFHVYDGTIDNTVMKCSIFPTAYMYQSQLSSYANEDYIDYMRSAVVLYGNSKIVNCFVQGAKAPITVTTDGVAEIKNSVLYAGTLCNLLIRKAQNVILDDVTTIQKPLQSDYESKTVMGLGVFSDADVNVPITLRGDLRQYNWLSESDKQYIGDDYQGAVEAALAKTDYVHTVGGTKYVNAGFIFANNSTVNITDERDNKSTVPYEADSVSFSVSGIKVTGRFASYKNSAGTVPTERFTTTLPGSYRPSKQNEIEPDYTFDYTTKNYQAFTDGSNEYCYYQDGEVKIAFDEGNSKVWDTSIFTVSKFGKDLDFTVTIDGADYKGKSITLNSTCTKTVNYTYTDTENYRINTNGELEKYSVTYTKKVILNATAVKASGKHAEFKFGSTTAIKKQIGEYIYIIPDTSVYTGSVLTYNGVTYALNGSLSDGASPVEKTLETNLYYYITPFANLTITDYADGGTGAAVTYNSSTTSQPSGLAFEGFIQTYGSSKTATGFTTVNKKLVYQDGPVSANNDREAGYVAAKFSYTDNLNQTYYFYLGDYFKKYVYCLIPSTLITMADGSVKTVDKVKQGDMVLVWDMDKGEYSTAPVLFNDAEKVADYNVIYLKFSDGTKVGVVSEHGFFDVDKGKYVYLDKNASQYIGDSFVKQDGKSWKTVKLTDVEIKTEHIAVYSPVTYSTLNIYANGMLSMPGGISGLFNIYSVDTKTMKVDADKKQKDIEKYGLFTLNDFGGMIPQEAFDAYNGADLKVAMGKGMIDWETIERLANRYIPLM